MKRHKIFSDGAVLFVMIALCTHGVNAACDPSGDGVFTPGEGCDDGNNVNDDGCNTDCTISSPLYGNAWVCNNIEGVASVCQNCGSGIKEGTEECDFGGDTPHCVGCQWVPYAKCCQDASTTCTPVYDTSIVPVFCDICGNGVRAPWEVCDDGNITPLDGCEPATCAISNNIPGWTCNPSDPGVPTSTSVCQNCGNGIKEGTEACDNNSPVATDGDGCSATCTVETGWTCPGNVCTPICGNGQIHGPEECDDNNLINGDGCSAQCKKEYPLVRVNNRFTLLRPSGTGVVIRDFIPAYGSDFADSDVSADGLYVAFVGGTSLTNGLTVFHTNGTIFMPDASYSYPVPMCSNAKVTSVRFSADARFIFTGINCITWTLLATSRVFRHSRDDGGLGTAIGPIESQVGGVIRRGLFLHSTGALIVIKTTKTGIQASKLIRITNPTISPTSYIIGLLSSGTSTSGTSSYNAAPLAADLHGDILSVSGDDTGDVSGIGYSSLTRHTVTATDNLPCGYNPNFPIRSVQYSPTGSSIVIASDNGLYTLGSTCSVASSSMVGTIYSIAAYHPKQPNLPSLTRLLVGQGSTQTVYVHDVATSSNDDYAGILQGPSRSIEVNQYYRPATATCGDGYKDANEACDDGNLSSGDGCSNACTIESGYTCTVPGGYSTSVCTATAVCGNGIKEGTEACDNNSPVALNGDGCSSTCEIEEGWTCTGAVGSASTCTPICGDGLIHGSEECDDHNTVNGDGCSDTCVKEVGWTCAPDENAGGLYSWCSPTCGDGNVVRGVEACDLGATLNDEGTHGCESGSYTTAFDQTIMNVQCSESFGWRCSYLGCSQCGDGAARHGEVCDDKDANNANGCSNTCEVNSGYTCWRPDGSDRSVCFLCGDGIREGPEGCDLGRVDPGDPNSATLNDGTHGCSSACTVTPGYRCNGACTLDSASVFGFAGAPVVSFRDRATLGLSLVPSITVAGASFTRVHSVHNGPGRGSQLLISLDQFGPIRVHNISVSLVAEPTNLVLTMSGWPNGGVTDAHLSYNASLAGYWRNGGTPGENWYQFVTVRPPHTVPHPNDLALRYIPGDPDFDLLRSSLSPNGLRVVLSFTLPAAPAGHVRTRVVARTHPDAPTQSTSVFWEHPTPCASTDNYDAQWSPDGQFLAITCGPLLQVYDMHTLPLVLSYESTAPDSAQLRYITWSPRSNKLVVTTSDARVVIFDPTDPDSVTPPVTVAIFGADFAAVYRPVFHADGSTFSAFAVDMTTSPPIQTVVASTFAPGESHSLFTTSIQPVSGGAIFMYSPSVCGDSVIENAETCDLGPGGLNGPGTGCVDGTCTIAPNYACTAYYVTHPQTCVSTAVPAPPRCSDGLITAGEECDDGNMRDGDGCDSRCAKESPTETCVAGLACTPGHDNDCDGDGSVYTALPSPVCTCEAGRFGPRCRTLCDTDSCPSGRGFCDASASESEFPGFCRCNAGYYPSSDPFAPRCSVQLSPASCNLGTTFDTATGQCLPTMVPVGTCYICHRYSASTTAGFGTTTFATLAAAAAVSTCSTFEYTCQPTQLDNTPVVITGDNVAVGCNIGSSGNDGVAVFGGTMQLTGANPSIACMSFVDTGGASSAPFSVDLDATGSVRIDAPSIPEARPSPTPPYDNSYGNRASDDMCDSSGLFTRQVLDSFFDIFIDAVYQVPGSGTALRASPMLSSLYLYNPVVTPQMVACVVQYMAHRGLAPSFMGRKRPGATAVSGKVQSPFTFNNMIVIGYLNAVDFDLSGGSSSVLTMINNTFMDIPGTAAHLQGVAASDVYNNHFILCGGDTSTSSGHVLFIEGVVPAVPGYHVIAENVVSTYRSTMQSNTAAFYLKNMPSGTFTIQNNYAALEGPLPLKGFPHGMVLDNLPNPVFTEPTMGLCAPPVLPDTLSDKADERCVAIDNPLVQGTVTYITRVATTVPMPAEADYCNDLCSPSPFAPDTNSAVADYEATSVVTASTVINDPQAFSLAVTFSVSDTYADSVPVVEFKRPMSAVNPISESETPRHRSFCASRLTDDAAPWSEIFNPLSAAVTNPLWTVGSAIPANPNTVAWTAGRSMTLTELLGCTEYGSSTLIVEHVPSTNTYSFEVCTGLIRPNDVNSEPALWTVTHRGCTPISLTIQSEGSVLVEIVTAQMDFSAYVFKSQFLSTSSDQLEITLHTQIDSGSGEDLRDPVMLSATNTLLGPYAWTISTHGPCMPSSPVGKCLQSWTVTSNQPSQTTQELFIGTQSFTFALYRNGNIAVGGTLAQFDVSINIERASEQALLNRVGLTATVYRDQDATVAYSTADSFIVGEYAYVKICSDIDQARENDIDLTIDLGYYCTPVFPLNIQPYDPLNPTTTGCSTMGAGIGSNQGQFYIPGGTAVNAQFDSGLVTYPSQPVSCKMVKAQVNNWIGDRVSTFLQFSVTMTSTLDPGAVLATPGALAPIHRIDNTPKKINKKTSHVAFRIGLTGQYHMIAIPGVQHTTSSASLAVSSKANNVNYVEVDSPAHVGGASLRVSCANPAERYLRTEPKRFDANYACVNPADYNEVKEEKYSWFKPSDAALHRGSASPVPVQDTSDDDILDDIRNNLAILIVIGVIILLAMLTVCVIYCFSRNRRYAAPPMGSDMYPIISQNRYPYQPAQSPLPNTQSKNAFVSYDTSF